MNIFIYNTKKHTVTTRDIYIYIYIFTDTLILMMTSSTLSQNIQSLKNVKHIMYEKVAKNSKTKWPV